jgi:hypothetical protein
MTNTEDTVAKRRVDVAFLQCFDEAMSGPCRSAVSRAVMSVLQARHEGPGVQGK